MLRFVSCFTLLNLFTMSTVVVSTSASRTSSIERLYRKYEPLADKYATSLWNYQRLGYDKEDLVQELRIRIYEALIAYGRKWRAYKEGKERKQPVPIKYYLMLAMKNICKDFMGKIERHPNTITSFTSTKSSKSSDKFLVVNGCEDTYSDVDLKKCRAIVDGIDIFQGLDSKLERYIFSQYLAGHSIVDLKEKFKNSIPPTRLNNMIRNQCRYLRENTDLKELLNKSVVVGFVSADLPD